MKFNFDIDDIKYIKIVYRDEFNNVHSLKSGIKNITEHEITSCSKFDNNLKINTPQEITLSIICKEGLYKTKTILKSVENDEPYVFFFLKTPQGFEFQQNREYFRVVMEEKCIYSVRQRGELKRFNAKTINISANGICIQTSDLVITERDAYVNLNLNGKNIETSVKYIRSEKCENGYLISFAFVNLSNYDRDLISQICIKKQLEQRRNSLY